MREFFARFDPAIRTSDKTEQLEIVDSLLDDPGIRSSWTTYNRGLYGLVHFIKQSGRYRLFAPGNLGKGDFNVFRMFVETSMTMTRPGGAVTQVLPSGFYSGANSMALRRELFEHWRLRYVLGFINTGERWFPGVASATRFCAYSASKGGSTDIFEVAFEIDDPALLQALSRASIPVAVSTVREQSPDALAIPEISDVGDAALAAKMYSRWPKWATYAEAPISRHYQREIDMGNDRDLFGEFAEGLPLYEGRMIDQFDHRAKAWRSGRGRSAVWVPLRFGRRRQYCRNGGCHLRRCQRSWATGSHISVSVSGMSLLRVTSAP